MSTETLLTITHQLRYTPNLSDATQALVDWLTNHYSTAYLMLPNELIRSENTEPNPDLLLWLNDPTNWRNLRQPELSSGTLLIPLVYGGRTQGALILENATEDTFQALPLVEVLAARLDTEFSDQLMQQ